MADSANSTAPEPPPPDGPVAALEAPSALGSRARLIALAVVVFALGFVLSWTTRPSARPRAHNDIPRVNAADDPHPPQSDKLPRTTGELDVRSGAELLQEGRYEQALSVFQRLAATTSHAYPTRLALHLAICHEELGHWTSALQALQKADPRASAIEAAVVQVAQARIQLRRRQSSAAQDLLWPLMLQSSRLGSESPILTEARFLLALATAQETLSSGRANTLDVLALPPPGTAWNLDQQLVWLAQPPPKTPADRQQSAIRVMPGGNPGQLLVSAQISAMAVRDVIEQLAGAAKRKVEWTSAARQLIDGRSLALALADRDLTDLLHDVAAARGLTCAIAKDTVQVSAMHELPEAARHERRRTDGKRLLHAVVNENANHALAPAALLALGHLAGATDHAEALTHYKRIRNEMPWSHLAVNAAFHHGALLRQTGKHAEAQPALFNAADQAPGHALAPVAMLHLGQMALEQGDWRRARSLLRRAEAMCSDESVRPAIVLSLATAHALGDEPQAAVALLVKNRECWIDESSKQLAGFVAAYGRFRHATHHHRQSARESNELMVGLLRAPAASVLGNLGSHVQATAYADLGMWQQAAEIYEKVRAGAKGPLAEEMTFRHGEALARLQRHDDARRVLAGLTETIGRWSGVAHRLLAELDLADNQLDKALARCRQLLGDPLGAERNDVLVLMGRVYERQGNFMLAARCFAGQAPEEAK